MTVGLRCLSGCWPWLLLAAVQVGFGRTGVGIGQTGVHLERSVARAAVLVTLLNREQAGKAVSLEGVYAGASVRGSAEGMLMQAHPLSLCNSSEDEQPDTIFISIVKLESPERRVPSCLPLLDKARVALERGAQAVIFDVTDDVTAADQLWDVDILPHPVVLVQARDAEVLMSLVNKNEEAMVRIKVVTELPKWPQYDLGILLIVVMAVMLVAMAFAFHLRCRSKRTWLQDSVHQETARAVSRLESRRYSVRRRTGGQRLGVGLGAGLGVGLGAGGGSSSSPACAICLEDFLEGQDLRIVSCAHEFHKECVDPWLLQHRTCPLCMHSIMGKERAACQASCSGHQQNLADTPGIMHPPLGPGQHPLQRYPAPPPIPSPHTPPVLQALRCLPRVPLGLGRTRCGHLGRTHGSHGGFLSGGRFGRGCFLHRPRYVCCSAYSGPCSALHQPLPQPLPQPCPQPLPQPLPQSRPQPLPLPLPQPRPSYVGHDTERSGYLAAQPSSDSGSGPCPAPSSDFLPRCSEVSLQGVCDGRSASRSSPSSDREPPVHCGPARARTDGRDEWGWARPTPLDPEEHAFGHCRRHHQHSRSQLPERGSDEERDVFKRSPRYRTEELECEPTAPPSRQAPPPCCRGHTPRLYQHRRRIGFSAEGAVLCPWQGPELLEDCHAVRVHYCPPLDAPLPLGERPCCRAHTMRSQRPLQARSELTPDYQRCVGSQAQG